MLTILSRLRLKHRLGLLLAALLLMIIATGTVGLFGLSSMVESIERMQTRLLAPGQRLAELDSALLAANLEVLRSFQHEPGHRLESLHNHPATMHLDRADKHVATIERAWPAYQGMSGAEADPTRAALVTEIESLYAPMMDNLRQTLAQVRAGNYAMDIQRAFLLGGQRKIMAISGLLEKLRAAEVAHGATLHDAATELHKREVMIVGGIVAISVAVTLVLGLVVSGSITRPLHAAVGVAEAIAAGRLNQHIEVDTHSHAEVDRLLGALATMQASLREMIGGMQQTAARLTDAATTLAGAAGNVAETSDEQSGAAGAMAASVEQMTVSINHVSDASGEAATLAQEAGHSSEQGSEVVHGTAEHMRTIANTIESGATEMDELKQRAGEISHVVGVIREVADQTNLLALNAAIEAARAGEQGRGFAVVADEVRKLAERTANSTNEIEQLIIGIQTGVGQVSTAMERSVSSAREGVDVAGAASEAIGQIAGRAQAVDRVVGEIAEALREQGAAANELASNVERIAHMAERNAHDVAGAREAAEALSQLALDMNTQLQRFTMATRAPQAASTSPS